MPRLRLIWARPLAGADDPPEETTGTGTGRAINTFASTDVPAKHNTHARTAANRNSPDRFVEILTTTAFH
jgi:hypothetical protein